MERPNDLRLSIGNEPGLHRIIIEKRLAELFDNYTESPGTILRDHFHRAVRIKPPALILTGNYEKRFGTYFA